jgi:hypothetical protein
MVALTDVITEVALLVAQFDPAGLSSEQRARFQQEAAQLSPVVRFANIAELMFANIATVGDEGRTLGAQCAHICRMNNWHSLGDPRGLGVVKAFKRELGEDPPDGETWPDPADDPAAADEWLIA